MGSMAYSKEDGVVQGGPKKTVPPPTIFYNFPNFSNTALIFGRHNLQPICEFLCKFEVNWLKNDNLIAI